MAQHAASHAPSHGGGAPAHHTNYVKVWLILVVLLVVSVIGPMTGIRVIMLITAFGVALVKAYLVARNFMHLNVEKPIVHWVLGAALLLMVVMYAGLAPDVQKGTGQNWQKDAGWHQSHPAPAHGGGGHDSSAQQSNEAGGTQEHGATGH